MKALITGDSHVGTLRRGQLLAGEFADSAFNKINIRPLGGGHLLPTPFFADHGDHCEIVEASYRRQFKRFPPKSYEYDWIGFSGPLHTARVWRDQDWTRFVPWNKSVRTHSVSTALLRQVISDDVKYSLQFLDVIRRTTRTFVIESPWPFMHHPAILRNGSELVRFLHEQYRCYVLNELENRGIPVVKIDTAWLGEDGYMQERFRHENPKDGHHGNAEFGRLMLGRIAAFLNQSDPSRQMIGIEANPGMAGV